jgi:dihydroneopterin aldolase
MDKNMINALRVQGILGVNDWERTTLREIFINARLVTITSHPGKYNAIADCVDYSQAVKGEESVGWKSNGEIRSVRAKRLG